MYTEKNYKTKEELIAAVKEHDVPVYQPGGMFPTKAGSTCIQGPHEVHKWYASVVVTQTEDGDFVILKGSKVK